VEGHRQASLPGRPRTRRSASLQKTSSANDRQLREIKDGLKEKMDFNVGMIQGENYYFSTNHAWPAVKLSIEPQCLTLVAGFKAFEFKRDQIARLSEYRGFTWIFARGIRIEHALENVPRLIVFWAFDLTEIKRTLADNRFALAVPED
jgi:hypothetical protein